MPRTVFAPTRRTLLASAMGAAILSAAVGHASAEPTLNVVATTGMIADAVAVVGGERVAVTALMGPGVDPHAFRQTRTDVAAMLEADLVLWHGLYLEAQLEEFLLNLEARMPVFAVAEALPDDVLIAHDEYEGRADPHVWMVPELWQLVVDRVEELLIETDPDGAGTYQANAEAYSVELMDLGAYVDEVLGSIPEEQRALVTAHDAFNYLGSDYGFEVMGIQGISTESEAGLRRIEDLVDVLVERRIEAVFVETSVSDRNIQALIEGAGAGGHEVEIGGELFSDAMGEPGTYIGTYLGMIDHNATTIARALGGDAPADGRLGLLDAEQ